MIFSKVYYTEEGDTQVPDFKPKILKTVNFKESDILIALKSLNANMRIECPDKVQPRILKECAEQLSYPIYKLFVRNMAERRIPNDWRDAEVCPIFKKGKKFSPGNYRSVSLTSVLCKLMEGFIRAAMYVHLIENNLLSPHQFGFCKGRS